MNSEADAKRNPPLARHSRLAWPLAGRLAILAVLLLGFALRLHGLGAESLWLDEMGQASAASGSLLAALAGARQHHGAAPLDYLLTWLALHVARQEFMVRLPAALLGTLTLALVYRLGRELFDDLTGILAALLLAVAPFHLRYSQEARFYALFAGLAVASTLALTLALRRNERSAWLGYSLTLIAALYSHYYAVVLALCHGVVALAYPTLAPQPERQQHLRRNFLLSCLAAAVAFLPWVVYAVVRETGTPRAAPPLLEWQLWEDIHEGLALGERATGAPEPPLATLWLFAGLAILGALAGLARRRSRPGALLALLPLLLAPPLIVLALRRFDYFFALRQALFLLPFYLLLVGLGISWLARTLARLADSPAWARAVQASVFLALSLALIWQLEPAIARAVSRQPSASTQTQRQDWRDALAFVHANAAADDLILAAAIPNHYFGYYATSWASRIGSLGSLDDLQAMDTRAPAVWILTAAGASDFLEPVRAWLRDNGALPVDFGQQLIVFYWQPGNPAVANALEASLSWALPRNLYALEQLTYAYETSDLPEAADRAAAQGAALASSPEWASFFEMLRGSVWRNRDQDERAVAAYEQALALWPDNVEALVRLGERLLHAGRVDEGAARLERAAGLAPDHYWAQRLLAEARRRQGRLSEAAAAYRAAIALQADEPETHFLLGDVLAAAGDAAGARAAYERYVQLAPDGPRAADARQRLSELP